MDSLIQWLLSNHISSTILLILVSVILILIISIYLMAFFQGREISFWPPKIGEKPQTSSPKSINSHVGSASNKTSSKEFMEIINSLIKVNSIQHFNGWKSCDAEILEKIKTSKEVRIMKIKGRDLYKEISFKNAIAERTENEQFTHILLQAPYSSFVNEKISKEFKWNSLDSYINDIQHSLSILCDTVFNYKEVVRLYDFRPILRLYIFDDDIFVSIYSGSVVDRTKKDEIHVWQLSRKSDPVGLAKFLEIYFDSLWEQSKPINWIINKNVIFQPQSYVLLLPVIRKNIKLLSEKAKLVRGQAFSPKSELHITIIGKDLGQRIKEKISSSAEKKDLFLQYISETDWSYEIVDDLYLFAKEKEFSANEREKKSIHTETIVQMAKVPSLENFYQKIEAITGITIPPRPVHITLFTHGDSEGIGVNNQVEFNEVYKAKLGTEELKVS